MKDLVKLIAESLVDQPERVSVSETRGSNTTVIELIVDKQDLGKVIGKQGRTAQAIRNILSSVSARNKERVVLEIVE